MRAPFRRVFSTPADLARAAADRVADLLRRRSARSTVLSLVLTGGRTPDRLYRCLFDPRRTPRVPWAKIHLFWGDERGVPLSDPASNAGAARKALGRRPPVPRSRQHPFFAHPGRPAEDARRFESHLRRWFRGRRPDVVLMGVGEDGHTASLFPGFPAVDEKRRWVVPVENAPKSPPRRLTLTLPFFNRARHVIFVACGKKKKDVLRRVWSHRGRSLPAARVRPSRGSVEWWVDREAFPAGAVDRSTFRTAPPIAPTEKMF